MEALAAASPTNGPLEGGVKPSRDPEIWKVSKGFEAIYMQFMLRAMRKTIHHSEFTQPSSGRRMFTELLDAEYAERSSGSTRGGLADMIYRQLSGQDGRALPRAPRVPLSVEWEHAAHLPNRRSPLPPKKIPESQLNTVIERASNLYHVDSALIRSVIHQESGYNAHAVSKAGAKGLMQLMDPTARDLGVRRVFDVGENVMGGTRYLAQMLERYQGDEVKALAAYNAGPRAVDKHNGVPPYPETQNYVTSVLALKKRYELNHNQHNRKNLETQGGSHVNTQR